MDAIAFELATSEVGMLLDCAACNAVTAATAPEYKRRVSAIVAEAKLSEGTSDSESVELDTLEATSHAYIDAQVDRFDRILASEPAGSTADLQAVASMLGAKRSACGFTIPGVHQVTLNRADNARLKSVVEASADVHSALAVVKSMVAVTASHVSYEFSVDSIGFLKSVIAGMPSDRTAASLRKAFGGIL